MKERGIIFSAPMVRAILDGRKTMTRRIVKPQPLGKGPLYWPATKNSGDFVRAGDCLYGSPGDRLWVKESYWKSPHITSRMLHEGADTWPDFLYAADNEDFEQWKEWGWKKKPSIHMPRWASRITLEIEEVRVERLQKITEEDAMKEGAQWVDFGRNDYGSYPAGWSMEHPKHHAYCLNTARMAFANFINIIHRGERWNLKPANLWDENPWVWVIEFKRA